MSVRCECGCFIFVENFDTKQENCVSCGRQKPTTTTTKCERCGISQQNAGEIETRLQELEASVSEAIAAIRETLRQ